MVKLSTFEDVFNRLILEYKNKNVTILMIHNNIILGTFQSAIDNILIKPVSEEKLLQKNFRNKIGIILIKETDKDNQFSIPFILGFNTMEAVFLKDRASITSMGLKYIIKKTASINKI